MPAVRQQINQLAELLRSPNGQTLSALIVVARHDQVLRAVIGQRWMAQRRRRGLKRTWAAVKTRERVDGLRVVSVPEALYTSSVSRSANFCRFVFVRQRLRRVSKAKSCRMVPQSIAVILVPACKELPRVSGLEIKVKILTNVQVRGRTAIGLI